MGSSTAYFVGFALGAFAAFVVFALSFWEEISTFIIKLLSGG